jgi:hypothetical protein
VNKQKLLNEYIDAAEAMYQSLGIACHSEGGEIVAFVTGKTVEALNRFHKAHMAIAEFMGVVPHKDKE